MFIGHYAVALASKRAAPRTSLGTLFVAAQWQDLIWSVFLLLGLEHVGVEPGNTRFIPLDFYDYPFSHSLLTAAAWSVLFGGVYFVLRRWRRESLVVGLVVLSHWVLDFLTHRPDLPLWPGSTHKVGLGLWNSVPASIGFETALFAAGILLYLRTTGPCDPLGSYALWGLLGLVTLLWVASIAGPPPPGQRAVALTGLAQWIFVPWFFWIDRHRLPGRTLRAGGEES